MLYESHVAILYWYCLARMYRQLAPPFNFPCRGNQTSSNNINASDEVNAMLNYGYAVLESRVRKYIRAVGLDQSIGFLHHLRESNMPRVYDLLELYRWIVDLSVLELLEDGKLKKSDSVMTEHYHTRLREHTAQLLIGKLQLNFNRRAPYKNMQYAYDVVLQDNVQKLANYIQDKQTELQFYIPPVKIGRNDTIEMRDAILSMTPDECKKLGINKSTLWYIEKAVEARYGHKKGNKKMAASDALRNWINNSNIVKNNTLEAFGAGIVNDGEDIVEKYIKAMEFSNRSPKTIKHYQNVFRYFQKRVDKPLTKVTQADVYDFFNYLKDERNAMASTRAMYLSVFKSVFGYAAKHKWIPTDPTADIPDIQIERRVNVPLTKDDIKNVLKVATEQDKKKNCNRYWIVIMVLYNSLVRASELTMIKKSDVDFDARTIKIRGKGAKERVVTISKECAEALRKYSAGFQYDQKLFDFHTSSIQADMRKLGRLAQLPPSKEFTPKKLRHSGATHWLKENGDVTAISKQLGHDTIASTIAYLDTTWRDVQKDFDEHHPSSRKADAGE